MRIEAPFSMDIIQPGNLLVGYSTLTDEFLLLGLIVRTTPDEYFVRWHDSTTICYRKLEPGAVRQNDQFTKWVLFQ